jgi:hypothetical protein
MCVTVTACGGENTQSDSGANVTEKSSAATTAENTSDTGEGGDEDISVFMMTDGEKTDYYKKLYPDKAQLVWLSSAQPNYEFELNEYLDSIDCDYVIRFRQVSYEDAQAENLTPIQYAQKLIESGEQIDILDSLGTVAGEDVVSNSYYYFAEKGLYEPLDEYLNDEKYSEIINSLPEKYWDSYRYKGTIYGVDNEFSSLCRDNGYRVYDRVFDKTDLTTEDFTADFADMGEVFKKISDTGLSCLVFNGYELDTLFPENYRGFGIGVEDGKAVNVFEKQEISDYYSTLWDYLKSGATVTQSLSSATNGVEEAAERGAFGSVIKNDSAGTTEVFYRENNYICSPYHGVGVYSGSQYKAYAFDALVNLTYNADWNNTISYGKEGVQYEVTDGEVTMKENPDGGSYTARISDFNNPMISYSYHGENGSTAESCDYSTAYERAEYLDGFGFLFDGSDISEEYKSVAEIAMNFTLNVTDDTDLKAYLSDFNAQLYNAGLQDILDEADRQLKEYQSSN